MTAAGSVLCASLLAGSSTSTGAGRDFMADTQGPSPTTLLDQLANLDPQERREVATFVRGLSQTFAETPGGKRASHVLGVLARLLDPG